VRNPGYTALGEAQVLALSDRDPALAAQAPMGRLVIPPSGIPELKPDIVLIASPKFEAEIIAQLGWVERHGIQLVGCSAFA